ncbi:MAG: M12 family metallo-peptidase [Tenacibaculum sp.]|nr:M12 family metallo-peptidase [Tenacibaculum sp.]
MNKITLLLVLFSVTLITAQSSWKKLDSENNVFRSEKKYMNAQPKDYSIYHLNLEGFKKELTSQSKGLNKKITLPGFNQESNEYTIKEYSNFTESLHPKYGFLKTYVIQGVKDETVTGKISIGTDGVHMVLNSPKKGTFYIDPYTKDNTIYIAYNRKDIQYDQSDFECLVKDNVSEIEKNRIKTRKNPNDGNLRTYRLALACTGEYASYHATQQGVSSGTNTEKEAAVLSAMNTAVTRINQIMEREVAVKLEIVLTGGRNPVLFLDTTTDGYTQDDISSMIDENIGRCNTLIGQTNYDIGHLFHKDNQVNGLAYTPSVCSNFKAGGVTGDDNPVGNAYLNIVCHELGHQFGANHTQNNTCNRNTDTSVETGSGSTIMSYAGICSPNVQEAHDDYYHAISIDEMWNTLQATSCATLTDTGNSAPTANAGSDYTVPAGTPLVLTGTGTDPDSPRGLSYNWEQTDNGVAIMPPRINNVVGPMFRSLPPSSSNKRYLPDLSTVLSGSTSSTWEVIPAFARELNFAFNVRDNNSGGGSSARDDMKITVVSSGGFKVTSLNSAESVDGGTFQTITWDVASTDIDPINCSNVRIKISIDGGLSFETLVDSTPNDGSESVLIPNTATSLARILIEGIDNIFYNVNTSNFTIVNNPTASVENFDFTNFNIYPNPSNGNFNIKFEVINTERVEIKLFDIRGRMVKTEEFRNTPLTFSEELQFREINSGIYLLQIQNGNKRTTKKLIIQ